MIESSVIDKSLITDSSVDLEVLKQRGVKRIQELAGNNWTDYNFHDPGITILETLCYALADLAYRAEFDISDILHPPAKQKIGNSLFLPHEVLATSPLSILDFKGLILDIEGVKNCEIIASHNEKVIPGSFDVKIEIHPDYDEASEKEDIKRLVKEVLTTNRPIGIIFNKVDFFDFDPVGIILDIELKDDSEPRKIVLEFFKSLQNYFSPEITFKSLQDLIDSGTPTETIFSGPILKNGFLLDDEIQDHTIRQQLFISELMSLAMSIHGVSFIRQLKVVGSDNEEYNWIYNVSNGKVPKIDPLRSSFICRYKNAIVFQSNAKSTELIISSKINHHSSHTQNKLLKRVGNEKNLSKYYSIQNDFPETYGIGLKGPAAGAEPEKLAAIKQFKGYLMIYDQIMANFLSQLNHVKYLFSTDDIDTSYAVQLMDTIPGIEYMYKQFIENYFVNHNDFEDKRRLKAEWIIFLKNSKEKLSSKIQESFETRNEFLDRRNRILDHLLARFGMDTVRLEVLSGMSPSDAITYKLDLLRNFPLLSAEKFSMGPSSVDSASSGLKCWFFKSLNLKGITDGKISSIDEMLSADNSAENLRIEVYSDEKPLNSLLKYGIERENLLETPNSEICIYNNDNELASTIFFNESSEENLREVAFRKICDLDRASENFLIVDHIAIKPSDDMPCYGFDALLDQKTFFCSERKYTLSESELFSEEFGRAFEVKDNFEIIETGLKEFRIRFQCSFGSLLTVSYYSSATEAVEDLDYFLGNIQINGPKYRFSTKYESHFVNLVNPFSHIVTVILPTWPSKFQNEGFKKYTEDFFYEELPSHLAVNVKWFDLEEMKAFELSWEEYHNNLNSSNIISKMNSLDKVMSALAF